MLQAVIFDMYETLITHYRCPLYFGAEIAADLGIDPAVFLPLWHAADADRSLGRLTLDQALNSILAACGKPSREEAARVSARRMEVKRACFDHLHSELLPMLGALKEHGLQIGLISNCYSEEAAAIRESVLFPQFDAVCLSWEEGVMKPDPEIYRRCMERLGAAPEACLYIGDGGSHELEAAAALGLHTGRAMWYMNEHPQDLLALPEHFSQLAAPMDVVRLADTL